MKYLSGINLMCILRTPNKKNTKNAMLQYWRTMEDKLIDII